MCCCCQVEEHVFLCERCLADSARMKPFDVCLQTLPEARRWAGEADSRHPLPPKPFPSLCLISLSGHQPKAGESLRTPSLPSIWSDTKPCCSSWRSRLVPEQLPRPWPLLRSDSWVG